MNGYDAYILDPYRVEWRADLTTGWCYMGDYPHQDQARAAAAEHHTRFGGQVRVVTRHVISAIGLGAPTNA